ncbi:MAG TPA: energy transducer TonB, partial [Gemmatimonadales bacterium]|nr:energy transducer TonB [Gemmatimonadales bacterium]
RSGDQAGGGEPSSGPPDQEPPVALNGDSPIQYPPRLYDQKVEGDVMLRLFVDSTGRLASESSRVAESSGYPALDSAALSGSRRLRFTPARRHGLPIATTFLQPIEFHHPQAGGSVRKGEPDTVRPRPAPVRAPVATPPPGAPVRVPRRDTTAVRRDTSPPSPPSPPADTTRPVPDSASAKPDTNATPH